MVKSIEILDLFNFFMAIGIIELKEHDLSESVDWTSWFDNHERHFD